MALLKNEDKGKAKKQQDDAAKVGDLIIEGVLDPYKIDNYKHVRSVAGTIDWPIHRMFNAIKVAEVEQIVKNETIKNETNTTSEVTIHSPIHSPRGPGIEESKGEANEPTKKTIPQSV